MLTRKLLTLTFAVGTLAWGVCFLPPLPHRTPHPPPIHIDLKGIQSIRVVAKNSSDSQHLDPAILAREVANNPNLYIKETGVKAGTVKENGVEDAVLEITVLSENAAPVSPRPMSTIADWAFKIRISASLTKHDGQQV